MVGRIFIHWSLRLANAVVEKIPLLHKYCASNLEELKGRIWPDTLVAFELGDGRFCQERTKSLPACFVSSVLISAEQETTSKGCWVPIADERRCTMADVRELYVLDSGREYGPILMVFDDCNYHPPWPGLPY